MVGIALLTLVPGVSGGSETYVRALVENLRRVGEHEYRVLEPDQVRQTRAVRLATMARARLRRERGLDVLHYPLTVPVPRADAPKVVTLHDLQHLDLPEMFPRGERAFRRAAWHPSLRRADRVIVISEFVRERAVARLRLDPAKIRVVPLGLDHATLTPGGAREPFLLYPARRWPHKNHARLFDALALIRRERSDLRLVLTGADFSDTPPGVESLGHVPWDTVVSLLQRASALVFPSLYEGFGLPPLEAMACGCPVACSNAAALPETVGDAARLFDPHDPRSIADAALEVVRNPNEWVRRGLERAARYSWDETARATDAVYGELL